MTRGLRHSARGLIVDPDDWVLLYRFTVPDGGPTVWIAPGGGIEDGESVRDALVRELDEETGLTALGDPVHVWRQVVEEEGLVAGYDGVINDYFLVRAPRFAPCGSLSAEQLAQELVSDFRWWSSGELLAHRGPEVFSPRDLPMLFAAVLHAPPVRPTVIGR